MKILHIHPSLDSGGIESMICALSNEMADQGYDITVCSLYKPTENHIFWYKLSNKINKDDQGKTNKGFDPWLIYKIYTYIKRKKIDIVHIHGFFYYYVLSVLLLHHKVKFFYTVHSDAHKESSTWDRRIFKLKKFAFRKHWINAVTISGASEKSFEDVYGIKGTLIYNGVKRPVISGIANPIDEVRISQNTKVFLHPGRISTPKNQLILCRVFNRLINEGKDVVLVIAGSKDDERIYKSIEPFFSDRIRYIGLRKDVPELMAKADAFCLPSIWEGMPVTLLEALSVGCIPICSPVGGIVNVVENGINGFLSESSSETDYYNCVSKFLDLSDSEIHEVKEHCIASFDPYNITNTATRYIEFYKDVINR